MSGATHVPLEVLVVSSRADGVAELVAAVLQRAVLQRAVLQRAVLQKAGSQKAGSQKAGSQRAADNVRVRAAGGFPSGGVQTAVGRVGELLGLDVISNFPQRLTPELHHSADVIVTLDDSAVVLTSPELAKPQRVSHWQLKPLVDHHLDSYLGMVEEIEERLRTDQVLNECWYRTAP